EAKWESRESQYPTRTSERAIFKERGMTLVKQTDLQRFMFEELLGFDTTCVFVVLKPGKGAKAGTITWVEAFDGLDLKGVPKFICDWVAHLPELATAQAS